MKIDDISLALFKWNDIPATKYHAGSSNEVGETTLG